MGCELSVVIPCLNEVRTLTSCIQKAQGFFRREGVSGEVVVADNGRPTARRSWRPTLARESCRCGNEGTALP